ncbi:MAG TPA: DNA damage-inducible protein D [Epsilonproteobacteria bacterium]|nr:DNA damage-inducible protein D [Campylobacterota bacterium]
MEKQIICSLTDNFESFSHKTEEGIEFWLARDLQQLLGYTKWDNFKNVLFKARTACETSGQSIIDHFADIGKMVQIGSGATKEIDDIMLTRYACYLIAQNGDSGKKEIAFAQTYFAVQTRKAELIEQKLLEYERVHAREKLKHTEKELSAVIYEQTGTDRNFGLIRSKGDTALFGRTTQQMKDRWGIAQKKPLADHMPTLLLKAKDFATEITIYNAKENNMRTEYEISHEHITNNKAVRDTLVSRGIKPENLSPEEDVKKVERKLISDEKKIVKKSGFSKK